MTIVAVVFGGSFGSVAKRELGEIVRALLAAVIADEIDGLDCVSDERRKKGG